MRFSQSRCGHIWVIGKIEKILHSIFSRASFLAPKLNQTLTKERNHSPIPGANTPEYPLVQRPPMR
jgi:hypothetical protein